MFSVFWPLGCFSLHCRLRTAHLKSLQCQIQIFTNPIPLKNSSNKKTFNHLEPPCFVYPLRNLTQHLPVIKRMRWDKPVIKTRRLFFGAFWLRLSTVLLLQHHPGSLDTEPFSGAAGRTPAVRDSPTGKPVRA